MEYKVICNVNDHDRRWQCKQMEQMLNVITEKTKNPTTTTPKRKVMKLISIPLRDGERERSASDLRMAQFEFDSMPCNLNGRTSFCGIWHTEHSAVYSDDGMRRICNMHAD